MRGAGEEHLIHLREGFLESGGQPTEVDRLIRESASSFATLLTNLARLDGEEAPDTAALARYAHDRLGVSGTLVERVLRTDRPRPADEVLQIYAPYHDAVSLIAVRVDRLEGPDQGMRPMKPMKKVGAWVLLALVLVASSVPAQQTEAPLPALTEPVNDFAGVIDAESRAEMDRVIRVLQAGTGDVIVVATVKDVEPYADIRDYAVRLFENQGRGIGERGKDNGLLVLLSTGDRRVWIEVGYGLEGAITDGFAGETTRQQMIPHFREGKYGAGLQAGVVRLAGRIAQDRGVTLDGLPPVRAAPRERRRQGLPIGLIVDDHPADALPVEPAERWAAPPLDLGPVERLVGRRRPLRRDLRGVGRGGRRLQWWRIRRGRLRWIWRWPQRRRWRRRWLVASRRTQETYDTHTLVRILAGGRRAPHAAGLLVKLVHDA